MSRSTHQIAVKAVDQTAGGFASIQARAAAASAKMRSMIGGAMAAAGAYLGFRTIKGGIDELGHLSDIAQKTSTSVDELTRATSALGVLGIQNMSVENLAKSFDYMAKTTGRSGMSGFYQTIAELGKIPDAADRGQAAMTIFGRSGMELMPLINAADTSVDALEAVVNAMPAVPQSAADAGDKVSDAMGIAANQIKSIWLQGLGAVCGWFDNEYAGGVREASLTAGNYMEFYAKMAVTKCISWYSKLQEYLKRFGDSIGAFVGTLYGGGSLQDAFDNAGTAYDHAIREYEVVASEIDAKEAERTERFKRQFDDRAIAIEKFNQAYDTAAVSLARRQERDFASAKEDASERAKTIRNELMLGGSNASLRTAVIGPQLQNETKKQTKILEKIASNTTPSKNTDENFSEI